MKRLIFILIALMFSGQVLAKDVSAWSTTAASNNDAAPDGAPEGMAPSTVNNIIRENMASVVEWYLDGNCSLASTGSSNAYVVAVNAAPAAITNNSIICFRANHANTGAATLQVDSLTAKAMKKNHDVALASGDIEQNQAVIVAYNTTDDVYEVVSQLASTTYIANIVEDTSPQLGADLDGNSFDIQFDDATGIRDDSDNEQLLFQKTASAVNQFEMTNAATANAPELSVAGGDANIDMSFLPKGTGAYVFKGTADTAAELRLREDTDNGTNYAGLKSAASVASSFTLTLPSADGTNGQSLQTDGAGTLSFANRATLGTESTTTSGTSIDFTGIPSTANVITMSIVGVSTSSTDEWFVQLGDAGGIESADYTGQTTDLGGGNTDHFSTGFVIVGASVAAATYSGQVILTRVNSTGTKWVMSSAVVRNDSTNGGWQGTGSKTLSAALTQVRFTTEAGSDTIDVNGGINITYW